jgi:hypothetical protein
MWDGYEAPVSKKRWADPGGGAAQVVGLETFDFRIAVSNPDEGIVTSLLCAVTGLSRFYRISTGCVCACVCVYFCEIQKPQQ